jgi:biotin carboxylase
VRGADRHILVVGTSTSKRGLIDALVRRKVRVTTLELERAKPELPLEAVFSEVTDASVDSGLRERKRLVLESPTFHEGLETAALKFHAESPVTHVTTSLEPCVEAVASVASRLKLPGLRPELARLLRDKSLMRRLRVAMPRCRVLRGSEVRPVQISKVPLPWVLKPARASRSLGVRVVDRADQLDAHHLNAVTQLQEELTRDVYLAADVARKWLLTELVSGVELEADVYVEKGKILWHALMEKTINTRRSDGFEEVRSVCPPIVECSKVKTFLNELAQRVYQIIAKPSGVDRFLIYPELIFDPATRKVCLLEVAYRNAGGQCPMLVQHAFGVDTFDVAAACAIGDGLDPLPATAVTAAAAQILYASKPGRLLAIEGFERVLQSGGVFGEIWEPPGREVVPVSSYLGYVLAIADTPREAECALDAVLSKMQVVVETAQGVQSFDLPLTAR